MIAMITTAVATWTRIDTVRSGTVAASSSLYGRARPCPICGVWKDRVVSEQLDYQFYSDASRPKRMTLRDVQCQACYALFKNPCYSTAGMDVLFAEAGRSYGNGSHAAQQVDWLGACGVLDGRRSVLDVGCGGGRFLSLMPETWNRMGIEPDLVLSAQCQDSGLACFTHSVDAPTWALTAPVDLITLWHVLEHLPSPIVTLRKLRALAHDNTRLVIEVPVLECGATPDVTGFLSPQHVTHFSKASLANALHQSGWQNVGNQQIDGYNGWRVIAEPGPMLAASPLACADVAHLAKYLEDQQGFLCDLEARMDGEVATPQRVIWGAGMHTESLYGLTTVFRRDPYRTYVLVDSDPLKQSKTWRGIPIVDPATFLPLVDWTQTDLLISSFGDQEAIAAAALALGVPAVRIVRLYEPTQVRSY